MPKPPANYASWPTKMEAAALLQCSEKSIEREVHRGNVRQAWRRMPGRRPIAVFNPDDIGKLKAETVTAVAVEPKAATTAVARQQPGPQQFMEALAAAITQPRSTGPALYLTLEQASAYTGLGVGALRRLLKDGKLVARKDGRRGAAVIKRSALEQI